MDTLTQAYATAIQLHQQLEAIAAQLDDSELMQLAGEADKLVRKMAARWASGQNH